MTKFVPVSGKIRDQIRAAKLKVQGELPPYFCVLSSRTERPPENALSTQGKDRMNKTFWAKKIRTRASTPARQQERERAQNADFHSKPQIFSDSPLLLEIQAFGGRRKPQKTADFTEIHSKPQETAGWAPSP